MAQSPLNDTTQPVDSEEEGRSPTTDRGWLIEKKVIWCLHLRKSANIRPLSLLDTMFPWRSLLTPLCPICRVGNYGQMSEIEQEIEPGIPVQRPSTLSITSSLHLRIERLGRRYLYPPQSKMAAVLVALSYSPKELHCPLLPVAYGHSERWP